MVAVPLVADVIDETKALALARAHLVALRGSEETAESSRLSNAQLSFCASTCKRAWTFHRGCGE
jgi:hypothetical protein